MFFYNTKIKIKKKIQNFKKEKKLKLKLKRFQKSKNSKNWKIGENFK